MSEFTHFNDRGESRMVDVTAKAITARCAVARGEVHMQAATLEAIYEQRMAKGDVLQVARLAGIMAAKQTAHLIPLCHPLLISSVQLDFERLPAGVAITAKVTVSGQTGVEMEALTAVSVAALTVYDMCKALDRSMVITNVCLLQKSGGRSGDFEREDGSCEGK